MRAIVCALAALLVCANAANEKKIVCYYSSWAVYRPGNGKADIAEIDPTLCTHLIYTFIGINENAQINLLDAWAHLPSGKNGFNLFNQLRQRSPGLKTLIAVGGWNEGSMKYSKVVGNPALRKTLVNNLANFVKEWNFDGLDFDWEYPNQRGGVPSDKKNYVMLLKELRERFDKEGLLLSAAVAGAKKSSSLSYIMPEVSQYLDIINVMAYDLHGSWEANTGINSPLYPGSWEVGDDRQLNVNACINYWISSGAPREKIVLGIPAYGRTFTLDDSGNNKIGAPARQGGNAGPYSQQTGHLNYNEFCESNMKEKWKIHFNKEQRVPYAVKGNQWIGYDDDRSITEKAEYVNKLGLGGAMIWSIEADDFKGICGDKYPLLRALNKVLRKGVALPSTTSKASSSTSGSSTATTVSSSTQNSVSCNDAGYERDPFNCSVYYYCQPDGNGGFIRHNYKCPDNLYYDEDLRICNWPYLVHCAIDNIDDFEN
ncbi:chitinase-3-like protein 1 [Copidosoma floridanum]|uniref:chitinase-3-like protein 1 n=1 Tax=Copidosoma floridanum TaxID=29053 RepID=UPI0006C96B9B|nr:chitinase-3-like protein 1 [Copidosoma floridanum]